MNHLKSKVLNKETVSYLVFGILTTVVDFITYLVCLSFSVNYLLANVIAWCVAVLFAYVTNKLFVFDSKSFKWNVIIDEILSFVGGRVFSLLFSLVFIYATVMLMGMPVIVSKIISAVFVVIINYVISKLFVFKEKKVSEHTGFLGFCKDNICYILSFVIPVCILLVIYKMRSIYPFGDNMYLRSDCYHQYAPFHMELYDKITNGGSFTYSWDIGLGVNFSALYSYYLASPVNWLIGLISRNHIIEIMNVFIIVKTALCSFTFTFYIRRHFDTKKTSIAALGIFYALSSYFAAFSWNLMWLDCLVLLPVILLGLEQLVKKDKCYMYCIALGIAILSNYYIAIMICIYCVLYFFALIYSDDSTKNMNYYIRKIKNFAVYSLLAGGFAAITVLPAYSALSATASGDFNFPDKIANYFSVYDMLSRSLINVDPAIFSAHDPNLYCSIIVFLLIPLYIVNPKIKFKEKIAKFSLIGVFLVSFNTNVPNYIWHGFHFPNSLPCRESFIYIFLILTMSYEALHYIREITTKQLLYAFGGSLALFLSFEKLMVGEDYSFMIIYVSIIFLLFYTIVIAMLKNNNYKQNFVTYLLFVVVIAESFINTEETALSTSNRTYYIKDNQPIEEMLQFAKDNDDSLFYRTEKYDRRTKNDAAWNGYYGASTFSSTASAGLSDYYGALGFEKSTNAYAYYGHTPLTESLFSIKYVISNYLRDDTDTAKHFTGADGYFLYKNLYTLPLGFMIPSTLEDNWDLTQSNPFEVQNSFCINVTDKPDLLFTRLMVDTSNQVSFSETTNLFVYVMTSVEKIKVTITAADGTVTNKTISSMKHKHILDLGTFEPGSRVMIESGDDDVSSIQFYAYSYDNDVFLDTFHTLNEHGLELTYFSDTKLKGTITAAKDGTMYTSIPYEKGWTVYVDGKQADTHAFENALLAVDLTAGEHKIVFKYSPAGFKLGTAISFSCVVIFIAIATVNFMKKKRLKEIRVPESEE